MIAGILLAAGRAKRFGADKLLHELDGVPLINHSLSACLKSRLPKLHVVLRSGVPELERAVCDVPDPEDKITVVRHNHAELGMMSSLKRGLQSLQPESGGAMIILADMPYVTTALIDRLISEFEQTGGIVIPEYDGELYHPRVIPKRLFAEFLELKDDERGSVVISRYTQDVIKVKCGQRSNYVDIDSAGDLG